MGNLVRPFYKLVVGVGGAIVFGLLFVGGCGPKADAPTNTGNSQYVEGVASKMGAQRARSRLPHGGNPPQGQ